MALRLFTLLITLLFIVSSHAGIRKPNKIRSDWTDRYDPYFKKYSKRYFGPQFNWRWFKAQGIAESNLKITAVSHVGAIGIMQIMPATFSDIKKANPHFRHLETPRWNIAAGLFYNRLIYRKIKNNVSSRDKLMFTFASYNAGFARVSRAIRRTDPLDWKNIQNNVPGETRHYVNKIIGLMHPKAQKS